VGKIESLRAKWGVKGGWGKNPRPDKEENVKKWERGKLQDWPQGPSGVGRATQGTDKRGEEPSLIREKVGCSHVKNYSFPGDANAT